MSAPVPPQLAAVLEASDDVNRRLAWAAFLEAYSALLLATARRTVASHDGAMDRYAFILDQLRESDFHRLRAFAGGGRGQFTTWLVVVARRLCVDHHRHTHGRLQGAEESSAAETAERIARRNLIDLVAGEVDWDGIADGRTPQPDAAIVREERRAAIEQVVGQLDVADQLLLTLRFEDDLPMAEIGPIVGLRTRWQVHRRLKAVLAELRAGLHARGIDEP